MYRYQIRGLLHSPPLYTQIGESICSLAVAGQKLINGSFTTAPNARFPRSTHKHTPGLARVDTTASTSSRRHMRPRGAASGRRWMEAGRCWRWARQGDRAPPTNPRSPPCCFLTFRSSQKAWGSHAAFCS
jgi:hypothetical protein